MANTPHNNLEGVGTSRHVMQDLMRLGHAELGLVQPRHVVQGLAQLEHVVQDPL